jgi:hypothetical protein
VAKSKRSKHGNGDGTVSAYELSALLGVSPAAVARAIREGRIEALPSGRFDPALARQQWASRTEPSRSRVRPQNADLRSAPQPVCNETDAKAAVALVQRILIEEGGNPNGPLTFESCRAAESILKSRERELRLEQARGKLICAGTAKNTAFKFARELRDSWMNWPARVAPLIAAEIGVDQIRMIVVLEKHVRQFLSERADFAERELKFS